MSAQPPVWKESQHQDAPVQAEARSAVGSVAETVLRAVRSLSEGVLITDADNRILFVNESFCGTTGYAAEEVLGRSPSLLNSGLHDAEFYQQMWTALSTVGSWQGLIWNRRKNGDTYFAWQSISAIRGPQGAIEHYMAIFWDHGSHDQVRQRLQRATSSKDHEPYRLFQGKVNHPVGERFTLESTLREALEQDHLELWFQPQVEIASRRICGVEALLRWSHPTLGQVSPADFLLLAEETGLIVPIGRWVLRSACATLREWQAQGVCGVRMAVNISPRQFQDKGLAGEVALALAEFRLEPELLELEITESAAMPHLEYSIALLGELQTLGVRVALDDFGTGFSSLSQIKRLPLCCLKVDQSFVRGISYDSADSAILTTIIQLGRLLGLEVIAEGVETMEQLAKLEAEGCQFAQGYLLARPMPAAQILPLLVEGQRLPGRQ